MIQKAVAIGSCRVFWTTRNLVVGLSLSILTVCGPAVPCHSGEGGDLIGQAYDILVDGNPVWSRRIPLFSIKNVSFEKACRELEKVSREADPEGRGIRMVVDTLGEERLHKPVSLHQQGVSVMNCLIALLNEGRISSNASRIVGDVVLVGHYAYRTLPIMAFIVVRDSETGQIIPNVSVAAEAGDFMLSQRAGDDMIGDTPAGAIRLSGFIKFQLIFVGDGSSIVESSYWNTSGQHKLELRAPGYKTKVVALPIVGEISHGIQEYEMVPRVP